MGLPVELTHSTYFYHDTCHSGVAFTGYWPHRRPEYTGTKPVSGFADSWRRPAAAAGPGPEHGYSGGRRRSRRANVVRTGETAGVAQRPERGEPAGGSDALRYQNPELHHVGHPQRRPAGGRRCHPRALGRRAGSGHRPDGALPRHSGRNAPHPLHHRLRLRE